LSYDENAVLDIIEKVSKSVVNISTVKLVHDIFYQAVPVGGMGSGTVIDENGLILTNHHVVGGAEKITVTLWNNQVLEGKIAGSCTVHDIAVIKVDEKGLEAAQVADSDKLRMGQRVYAIGNPFGLAGGPSVTSGVISAINRTIESERGLIENLVQTDAAIHPGNSGGPLIDITGKVVAINTAIIPYAQGIGFAIPINSAKNCTNEIVKAGSRRQPWLGIVGFTLSPQVARYYGLPVEHGVLVNKVGFGSPAYVAGLKQGDILLRFGDTEIRSIEVLVDEVRKHRVGEVVGISAFRGGKEHFFEVKLHEVP
jgi:S1-C subfamily serine protease